MGGREPTAGIGSLFGTKQPKFMHKKNGEYEIGRIIIRGKAYFRPEIVKYYLYNTIKNLWPEKLIRSSSPCARIAM